MRDRAGGERGSRRRCLGTGVWNDPRVLRLPALQGAWFAAPDNAGFNAFAKRYQRQIQRRSAAAGDALLRRRVAGGGAGAQRRAAQRYSPAVLTNPSGFNGADGVFRFRADGPNERGLAVMQISGGMATVVSPGGAAFPRRLTPRALAKCRVPLAAFAPHPEAPRASAAPHPEGAPR